MELNKHTVLIVASEYFKLHNYSEATLNNTKAVLNAFDNFLKINDYRDVKEKEYYDFTQYLKDEKRIKKSTLKTWLSILRSTFRILESEEKILVNPFASIKPLKIETTIRDKILTEEEVKELLGYYDLKTPHGFRNRTVFEVLYETGIRASELVNLEVSDFVVEEKMLFIRDGKGKKDRIVPLGESAYKYLIKYLDKIRKKLVKRKKRKYLFVNMCGEKLTKNNLRNILNEAYKKGRFKKIISPHVLRHTFATHIIKNGAGIRQVQLLLGHKTIKSTQIYINLNKEHLKKEYENYHALENELYFDVFSKEKKVIEGKLETGIYNSKKYLTVDS